MGSGYISGAYLFIFAVFGKEWHRVTLGFLPVATFTWAMFFTTFLHYDRFIHENLAFILWLVLYVITPFLVPWLWLRNRKTDPHILEKNDQRVPFAIRGMIGLIGIGALLFWIVNFIYPSLLISIWPWKLSPLTTRVISGFGMLLGSGAVVLAREERWSSWRVSIQSISLWQVLMIVGSIVHQQDYVNGSLLNFYFIGTILGLVILIGLYIGMEISIRRLKSSE